MPQCQHYTELYDGAMVECQHPNIAKPCFICPNVGRKDIECDLNAFTLKYMSIAYATAQRNY